MLLLDIKQGEFVAFTGPSGSGKSTLLQLIGLALAGGLVSAALPLLRNLRRNPIRDMRDDT